MIDWKRYGTIQYSKDSGSTNAHKTNFQYCWHWKIIEILTEDGGSNGDIVRE